MTCKNAFQLAMKSVGFFACCLPLMTRLKAFLQQQQQQLEFELCQQVQPLSIQESMKRCPCQFLFGCVSSGKAAGGKGPVFRRFERLQPGPRNRNTRIRIHQSAFECISPGPHQSRSVEHIKLSHREVWVHLRISRSVWVPRYGLRLMIVTAVGCQ